MNCWGTNADGELGDGATTSSSVPVQVLGVGGTGTLSGATAISAGVYDQTCAIVSGGGVDCWGYNADGELGNGLTTTSLAPAPVLEFFPAPSIQVSAQPVSVTVGHPVAAQATVSGGDSPTGTVTFALYGNPNGTGPALYIDPAALSGGVATSGSYEATATGTDYWVATYGGDLNNDSASSGSAAAPVLIDPAAVTGVSSPASNGAYGIGQALRVEVSFSAPVVVTGTPTLALNDGSTATYVSGNGTQMLTFQFTVAAGQNTNRLDEASASALTLSGGTISDMQGGAAADLTLPAAGAPASLGVNKAIVIDTAAPSLTVSHSADGALGWNLSSPVTETVTASDAGSGRAGAPVCSLDGATIGLTAGQQSGTWTFPVSGTGSHQVSCNVEDLAGNHAGGEDLVKIAGLPTVQITSPEANQTYSVGQRVPTAFACQEAAAGAGLASCVDGAGSPSPGTLDTSMPGTFSYTVTATSKDGRTATATIHYTVAATPVATTTSPGGGPTQTVAAGPTATTTSPGGGQTTTATIHNTVAVTLQHTSKPSNRFMTADPKAVPTGKITFVLRLPGAGRISVRETAWLDDHARRRFVTALAHLTVTRSGSVRVTVIPNKRGRALVRHDRYRITLRLWITFAPKGGAPRTVGLRSLRLPRPRAAHHR